jgi:hypothetical protein
MNIPFNVSSSSSSSNSDGLNMKDNSTGKLLWDSGSLGSDIFAREIEG